ncbi:FBD-associated F-box protein At5g56370-like [Trifolium pratense]|uniref:FBD-associated F-box protein At5g56370-like n=1 Tax=Trifolium pratense TaxID=57577 RepID=UPI001E694DD0|nr:FBD-associated F-box protein At5g56370-like [Trifolium pratense]
MEQEEDKLSNLPKKILHNILSRLPEDDANRTSVLSKAWLETWYTFPILCFSDFDFITESTQPKEDIADTKITLMFFQPVEDLSRKSKDFIEYVKRRLLRFWDHGLPIKEFAFMILDLLCMSEDLDFCLKLVAESGVEVLDLCFPDPSFVKDEKDRSECYVLPKGVIEVKSLTKLVLAGDIRVDQAFMNHSIKFFSLRELHLLHVVLEDEQAIERLISCCPLIEIITLMLSGGSMKSLSMHGLQKLNTVYVDGIKEVYIDEASSLKSLYYCYDCWNAPFKIDFIQCKYLKELLLCLNSTTIITDKWFLEIFPKFPFLETLEIWNCILSETINISSVQLKYLHVYDCSNLKEANIDAPNLLSCKFDGFNGSKPIISFLNISSQLEVHLSVSIDDRDEDLDVFYVRELLQNIKPENVLISLSLFIYHFSDAPKQVFLDIPSPPPSIKHMDLFILSELNENWYSSDVDFIRLCCIPETISWNLDNCDSSKAFVEFFYETLRRRKDDTKCWWRDLKEAKVTRSTTDEGTMLKSLPKYSTQQNIMFRKDI